MDLTMEVWDTSRIPKTVVRQASLTVKPMEARLTLSCHCIYVIFFGPKGHFVMNKYWAHVWRLRSLFLGTGYDKDSCVEQLSFELKQLKLQRKINKLKDSKSRELASSSSSNEEIDASSKEEAKGKRGRKGDKKSYNTTSFNYDNLPPCSAFTSVPVGKAPHFDRMDYTKWRY
jgi:hypothetical protein